jgi:hypothetical protein
VQVHTPVGTFVHLMNCMAVWERGVAEGSGQQSARYKQTAVQVAPLQRTLTVKADNETLAALEMLHGPTQTGKRACEFLLASKLLQSFIPLCRKCQRRQIQLA